MITIAVKHIFILRHTLLQFHCIEHKSFSVGVSNEKQLLSHDFRLQLGAKKVVESCRHAVKSGRVTIILASNKTKTRY